MRLKSLLAGLAATMFAAPALAHHSFAMFDREKAMSVSGVVKEYEWTNPHAWVHVMVADAGAKAVEWSFEMQSIAQDTRAGWRADSVKPGDKISVEFHPLKDGTRGGQLMAATLADGKRLGPPPPDGFLSVTPGDGGI
jgi:Family of unknown function (DUF6152)